MMRSLYSGVTGLKNHQTRMDVIGNNVANVNTTGFKRGRVVFQDLFSQTLQGASRPGAERGGVNPQQVGLGMSIATIDTVMSQGSVQTTEQRTDLAIDGDGFFIHKSGDMTLYTRQGNLNVDASSRLVNPANGFRVQGWNAELTPDGEWVMGTSGPIEDIVVPVGEKSPAKATSRVVIKSNLDARVDPVLNPTQPTAEEMRAGQVWNTDLQFYDSQGNEYVATLNMVKVDTNTWRASIDSITGDNFVQGSASLDIGVAGNVDMFTGEPGDSIYLTFNNSGALVGLSETIDPADRITSGELSANLNFRVNDGTVGPGGQLGYNQEIEINFGTANTTDGITQFADAFSTKMYDQDGYGMGYMTGFQIGSDGVITAFYSNGSMRDVAALAMSTFTNPQGLERSGDTYFVETINSGRAMVGEAASQNRGTIMAGTLEMSNVNLADEFTDMIVTQRGFQANSRTITTADQMLQELLGLKR